MSSGGNFTVGWHLGRVTAHRRYPGLQGEEVNGAWERWRAAQLGGRVGGFKTAEKAVGKATCVGVFSKLKFSILERGS